MANIPRLRAVSRNDATRSPGKIPHRLGPWLLKYLQFYTCVKARQTDGGAEITKP